MLKASADRMLTLGVMGGPRVAVGSFCGSGKPARSWTSLKMWQGGEVREPLPCVGGKRSARVRSCRSSCDGSTSARLNRKDGLRCSMNRNDERSSGRIGGGERRASVRRQRCRQNHRLLPTVLRQHNLAQMLDLQSGRVSREPLRNTRRSGASRS